MVESRFGSRPDQPPHGSLQYLLLLVNDVDILPKLDEVAEKTGIKSRYQNFVYDLHSVWLWRQDFKARLRGSFDSLLFDDIEGA